MKSLLILLCVCVCFSAVAQVSNKASIKGQKQYLSKVDYDGVYIDMGNGKYAELTELRSERAVIASYIENQPTRYLSPVPFISDESSAVAVLKVKKVIFKGNGYTGSFFDALYISKLENINAQKLQTTIDDRLNDIKVSAIAGKFGSSYSLKSQQPSQLLTPFINKGEYNSYHVVDYNKKTVSETTNELYLLESLGKGTYAVWNNNSFWLFKIE